MSEVKLNEVYITSGIVDDHERGAIALSEPIDGKRTMLSMQAQKYPDGTRVELTFRVVPGPKHTLVRMVRVEENARWRLVVNADVPELSDEQKKAWKSLMAKYSEVTEVPISGGAFPVTISSNINHPAYIDIRKWLQNCPKELIDNISFVKYLEGEYAGDNQVATTYPMAGTPEAEFAATGWMGDFWVDPDARQMFPVAKQVVANGTYLNVLALGPSGYGKTSLFKALASYLNLKFLRVDCAKITDTKEWFGTHEAKDGSTFFVPSDFTKTIEEGNCVVVLDEANRIEPWVQNSLFPLLDDEKKTSVHGMDIKMGPGVIIGFTMNMGVKYAGTFTVDQAFMNRIDAVLEVGAPTSEVEEGIVRQRVPTLKVPIAKKIVATMRKLRDVAAKDSLDVDVSTRTTLKVSKLVSLGMQIQDALRVTVTNSASIEERKSIIDTLNTIR